jgi:heme/copper-type cytochrome/quinol oxidase subunit 2
MNQVLAPTKQKIAQEESHILMWLLVWLSLSFAGVFLTTYYLHVWYAAIFVALLIGGSVYFCRRFQMTQNEDTQIKSHFALAMACRALNH